MTDAPGVSPETRLAQLAAAAMALAAAARQIDEGRPDSRSLIAMMDGAADVVLGAIRRYPSSWQPAIPFDAHSQMRVFIDASGRIVDGAADLDDCERMPGICRDIRMLKSEGESIFRRALRTLGGEPREPIHIVMWRRDLFQRLAWAIDRCGHAGRALERVCLFAPGSAALQEF